MIAYELTLQQGPHDVDVRNYMYIAFSNEQKSHRINPIKGSGL